ncbi:hypothetical protein [Paraburkholderia sp. BL9I2N2]|uniref:hypothetical protein n=1 Tax=Paraburkholderia sp. BL9I2N2 TaxID=1938809 RepID=UPI0010531D3A|nr:hypothetical protein [Paraburkholderia sp. BL9I2N2]TCK95579.1 hypothetical protein B0G74_2206 [Paraburkholderia sp. BL9I2N2]
MGSFISVPEWADALFNALEEISTAAFITSKVERGEICPETTLSELGIKPRSLTALTKSINGVIRAHRRRNSPKGGIAISDLKEMNTIGSVAHFVAHFVTVAPWEDALYKAIEVASDQSPITPKVQDGQLTGASRLYADMGIDQNGLEGRTIAINHVIDQYRQTSQGHVTSQQLGQMSTLGDLTSAVAAHIGVAAP